MSYTSYFESAALAARNLDVTPSQINTVLKALAAETVAQTARLLEENKVGSPGTELEFAL